MKKKNEEEELDLDLPEEVSMSSLPSIEDIHYEDICCVYGPPPPDMEDIDIFNDSDD